MEHLLIYPMATYMFIIAIIGYLTLRKRVQAVKTKTVKLSYFRDYASECNDSAVIVLGRHFDNQFQVPVLFFITCLTAVSFSSVNMAVLTFAWLFVVARLAHSYVHLGINNILHRMLTYLVSWTILLVIWVILLSEIIQKSNRKSPLDGFFN